ncbi:MAG: PASTA domain-containing protein [Acutalibacteraceae bacterium]|nr:PASTA domain-containing protein [Acutalibacteraceae bacterium]
MTDLSELCPGCMSPKADDDQCRKCGFDGTANPDEFLQIKTILSDRYLVGKVLSSNGEGATYMGYDAELDSPVFIREFFPKGLCTREGENVYASEQYSDSFVTHKNEFLSLARVLARMRNLSAILPVYDIFEQNDTAYYISEAVEYITLRDFLVRNGGRLNYNQMCRLFKPVFSTLASLHSVGVIHRGISPETMIVGRDGRLRVIGFCISDLRTARTTLAPELFKGYAAIEQYGFDGDSGAWTDVYSVAAVIYRTLIGSPAPDATERVTNDRMIIPPDIAEELPAYALSALADALQILPNDRTQSIEDFRDELSAAPNVVNRARQQGTPEERPRTSTRKRKKNSNKKYIAVAAVITVIVLSVVVLIFAKTVFNNNGDDTTPTSYTTSADSNPDYSSAVADRSKITVPDFTEYTASEILSVEDTEMIELNENFKIIWERKTDDSEKGTILSQSVTKDDKVEKGTEITLEVSIGNGMVKVPDVVDMLEDEAIIELCKSGFMYQNIVVQEVYDANEKGGVVLEQSIESGEKVVEFAMIRIKVNSQDVEKTTTTTTTTTKKATQTTTTTTTKPTQATTQATTQPTETEAPVDEE